MPSFYFLDEIVNYLKVNFSGCCVNLINKTVFYTKNGINLGVAFFDVPLGLYPTVGLQTPGEVADANFGE